MRVVFDANIVFAAAGWRGEASHCLYAMARRRLIAVATQETLAELRSLVQTRGYKCAHSPHTALTWYYSTVKVVTPAPLGKQRSRDAKDDPYLACALGGKAHYIVTRDPHLLNMGKPFGVEIIDARQLIARLAR